MCQDISRMKFSPRLRSCEALGGLFKYKESETKPFSSCETGTCLFQCQERSRKQFLQLSWCCVARARLFK